MTTNKDANLELIRKNIKEFPNFPTEGVLFRDIFSALAIGDVCVALKELLISYIKEKHSDIEGIVGLDARGFLFILLIAAELRIPCIPIRKKGKLPGKTIQVDYQLEYGSNTFEIQKDVIKPGQKILIIDDLLATGGSFDAAVKLVCAAGGNVIECLAILELTSLNGRDKLDCEVHSFIQYDD